MHSIDITKGQNITTVNRQWANRPDDQRFTSLGALREQVAVWADESFAVEALPGELNLRTSGDKLDMVLETPKGAAPVTNHVFTQLARIAEAPPTYLRDLPAPLAALNLNYGLRAAEQATKSLYMREDDGMLLRGITSPRYGRIFDRDVVDAVMQVAGQGTGDTRWKVPGTIDWGGAHGIRYNPEVQITKENTTLYASDRDLFLFLVDDMHPIEVGKLANGDPDLMFRGFYVWNSEVGERSFGIATMYLRGVCQNRNLWGVEGFNEITFKHSFGAPDRFLEQAAPALLSFSEGATSKVVEGVAAAKNAVVSTDDEARIEFLTKLGFSAKRSAELIAVAVAEEGRPQESLWDHAQAVSAFARRIPMQDERVRLEQAAGRILAMAE